ncbi:helix-turn-helix domain-containing protein [Amycolatopsis sp. WGS_07]|uniref:helix-turn-helix domain-containing protein n=1 Tax=Amycolatopsis sp. WGS_07 TaxID=3076764 RepID=UPI003872E420
MAAVDPRAKKIRAAQWRAAEEREGRQSRNALMLTQWRSGMSITEIAQEHRLSLSWTGRLLRLEGAALPPTRRGVKRTDLDVEQIIRDYESGASIQTVADNHHTSYGTVYRLLKKNKVKIRPHGGQNAIEISPLLTPRSSRNR